MQRMAESQQRESAGVVQGQTQRKGSNRRGRNKRKSYTVDFIKKRWIFWIINTKQLQSNKESTDRWWLSGKKTKAKFLQNWLWPWRRKTRPMRQRRSIAGNRSQRTDKYPLASNLLIAEFKLRRAAGSKVSKLWLKKKLNRKSKHAVVQKKLQNLKEATTGSTDSRKDTT